MSISHCPSRRSIGTFPSCFAFQWTYFNSTVILVLPRNLTTKTGSFDIMGQMESHLDPENWRSISEQVDCGRNRRICVADKKYQTCRKRYLMVMATEVEEADTTSSINSSNTPPNNNGGKEEEEDMANRPSSILRSKATLRRATASVRVIRSMSTHLAIYWAHLGKTCFLSSRSGSYDGRLLAPLVF